MSGFTVVYANPNSTLKKQCFEEVAQLARIIRKPWMVIGDFNEILMAAEKIGGLLLIIRELLALPDGFRSAI